MIRSFAFQETERLFNDQNSRRLPPQIQRSARRQADYALRLARYQKQKEIERDVAPLAA